MYTVTLRRATARPSETVSARSRATHPHDAISRVAARTIGYRHIGAIEHFPGGSTYHVQFATSVRSDGAFSLSDRYVVTVSAD